MNAIAHFSSKKSFRKKKKKKKKGKKRKCSKNSIDNIVLNKNGLDIFHLLWKYLKIFE